ncbi:DUF4145 domain-containing protein [Chitinophagaceae bacterium LWZ2-11]
MRKRIQTECHYCKRITYQTPLHTVKVTETNEPTSYITLECGGCQSISFLIRTNDPWAGADDNPYLDRNFSSCSSDSSDEFRFLKEEDMDELPTKVYDLYKEVIKLFESESKIVAGAGLRMLVESICVEQKIEGNNLQEQIKNLQIKGSISAAELPFLDKLRLIGNQSTHGIKIFPIEKLSYALDIINHTLISIYVLPKINRRLKI